MTEAIRQCWPEVGVVFLVLKVGQNWAGSWGEDSSFGKEPVGSGKLRLQMVAVEVGERMKEEAARVRREDGFLRDRLRDHGAARWRIQQVKCKSWLTPEEWSAPRERGLGDPCGRQPHGEKVAAVAHASVASLHGYALTR